MIKRYERLNHDLKLKLSNYSLDEINKILKEKKILHMKMRFAKVRGELESCKDLSYIKKDIAYIISSINNKL